MKENKKEHRLSNREALVFASVLLPVNAFFKLYLAYQEKYDLRNRAK